MNKVSAMGGEKDISKFNGQRGDYKTFYLNWVAHGICTKFDPVNKNIIHPDMPKDGICAEKTGWDKEKRERVKKVIKQNNQAMANIRTACASN